MSEIGASSSADENVITAPNESTTTLATVRPREDDKDDKESGRYRELVWRVWCACSCPFLTFLFIALC